MKGLGPRPAPEEEALLHHSPSSRGVNSGRGSRRGRPLRARDRSDAGGLAVMSPEYPTAAQSPASSTPGADHPQAYVSLNVSVEDDMGEYDSMDASPEFDVRRSLIAGGLPGSASSGGIATATSRWHRYLPHRVAECIAATEKAMNGPDGIATKRRRALALLGILMGVFLTVALMLPTGVPQPPKVAPVTLLISLDGTRAEYLERGLTPTLSSLAAAGLRAEYLQPSFPSVTFPNHYTLVTGRYPGEHGLVSNVFFDPALNKSFTYTEPASGGDPQFWDGAEPIWITAARQGVRAGVSAWPGSAAPHLLLQPGEAIPLAVRPAVWTNYRSWSVEQRVAVAARWLDLPIVPGGTSGSNGSWHAVPDPNLVDAPFDEDLIGDAEIALGAHIYPGGPAVPNPPARPRLIAVYIPDIDQAGHAAGPDSAEVNAALARVDKALGALIAHAQAAVKGGVNVVVVSDHGMTRANAPIPMDDVLPGTWRNRTIVRDRWPILMIDVKEANDIDPLLAHLQELSAKGAPYTPYRRENLPASLHFGAHRRIPPLVVIPHSGYQFQDTPDEKIVEGMHGYIPENNIDMRAIFLGHGPYFVGRRKGVVPAFENVEVYNVLCRMLGITPAPNSGRGLPWV